MWIHRGRYFVVENFDDVLLAIKQQAPQAPGGMFALIKFDSCEPYID